jgi:tetratricopeptide (TPR) repeat protein
MRKAFILILSFLIPAAFSLNTLCAQSVNLNLLPKYGSVQKNEAQLASDKEFLAAIDKQYKGDRKKASQEAAMLGWQFFRQGNSDDAMRRFNQAWLLNRKNGIALWGMAAIQGNSGKINESLKLFSEAERYVSNDIDFSVDQARTIGFAAEETNNKKLLKDALNRYRQIYKKAPQHVLNLQNWALALYAKGDYAQAWEKIKLAEAAPRAKDLDQKFIAELQRRMPRPK